jgi:acetyl esterase/lipase
MRTRKGVPYGPHGERNSLDLYLPDDATAPRPLVVLIHGGGWIGGSPDAYAWMGEPLVRSGFVAASITYRFWPDWPCPAALDDVSRAVRWLRRNAAPYGIDPTRVGALGGSAGAHLASYLGVARERAEPDPELAAYSARVQCVVDCYGPVDLVAMMDCASASLVGGFLGKPLTPETEADYRAASPLFQIAGPPPPFLIVHGEADIGEHEGQVPIGQSIAFHAALQAAGGDSTLLRLPNAPHGFSGDPGNEYTQAMWAAALPFLCKHLSAS